MKKSGQKHSIENAFVLVLFAIFAVTIVAVLALGANRYKSLVERDNESYNKKSCKIYELFSSAESEMSPEDGTPVMDAQGLTFERQGNIIHMISKDAEGREYEATVGLRCGKREVSP